MVILDSCLSLRDKSVLCHLSTCACVNRCWACEHHGHVPILGMCPSWTCAHLGQVFTVTWSPQCLSQQWTTEQFTPLPKYVGCGQYILLLVVLQCTNQDGNTWETTDTPDSHFTTSILLTTLTKSLGHLPELVF